MAKKESKGAKKAKRNDEKKAKKAVAKAAQVETPFEVYDLMFTVSQDAFLVRCGPVSVGIACGQPTAPRVELEWNNDPAIRQENLKKLKKDLLQALSELEDVQ